MTMSDESQRDEWQSYRSRIDPSHCLHYGTGVVGEGICCRCAERRVSVLEDESDRDWRHRVAALRSPKHGPFVPSGSLERMPPHSRDFGCERPCPGVA